MAQEVELKLACTKAVGLDEVCKALASLDVELDRGQPETAHLHNTYYDSVSLDFRRRRVALRVRKTGGRYIQTFKTAGQSVNGIHQRGEWEWDIPSPDLDAKLLESLDSKYWEHSLSKLELIAVFTTDFDRTSMVFCFKGLRFELVLDVGQVCVGTDGEFEPINEIEVEYLGLGLARSNLGNGSSGDQGGEPSKDAVKNALEEISETLTSVLPLVQSDQSKAQRGYALFDSISG